MKRSVFLAALLAATPICVGADTYGVTPGFWEIRTNWLGIVTKTERYCVAADRISKILAGPCNHNYQCNYPVQRVADGQAYFEGEIRGRDEAYHVSGGGTYSPTTMEMRMSGSGHWHIIPIIGAQASVKARLISPDCPAGSKKL
jgi:hypothetical protein